MIDYLTGEVHPEPVRVPEEAIGPYDPSPSELAPGDIAFMYLGGLWVHPDTQHLWIDEREPTWRTEEMGDKNIMDFARLLCYEGLLVVDIAHIGDIVRQIRSAKKHARPYCSIFSTASQ